MKVLVPTITCIMTSHMKSPFLRAGLDSVLAQTRLDLQLIVVDSGTWVERQDVEAVEMRRIYDEYHIHPLIDWVTTGQRVDMRDRRCPIAHVTNEVIRADMVRGEYLCFFCDDDLYKPTYMERMAGFLDVHPEHGAVWCSQDRTRVLSDGKEVPAGPTILALGTRYTGSFDQQVDLLQIMLRTSLLDQIGDPWFNEDPTDAVCRHSDGPFMDRVAELVGGVPNIDEILVTHRYTPLSTYSPS